MSYFNISIDCSNTLLIFFSHRSRLPSKESLEGAMTHYHIRWANSKLDWEAFETAQEAKAAAELLRRPNENYVIEELDGNCQRCNKLATAKATLKSAR